jgi:SAM-dependent methyltransferase
MFIGTEQALSDAYSVFEKLYIRIFGIPIVGLRIRARNIFALIPGGKNFTRILDAGCGAGVFSFNLARRYPEARITGMDLSRDEIAQAQQIAATGGFNNASFEVGDIAAEGMANSFDLIICVDILEHIDDDDKAIAGLYRKLTEGGILVLHIPHLYRRYPFLKKQINFDVVTHVRPGYEFDDISAKVSAAGFSIQASGFTYGFLETLANNISYMITGARKKNRFLYALTFPFLNLMSKCGAKARPGDAGAGIYILAEK